MMLWEIIRKTAQVIADYATASIAEQQEKYLAYQKEMRNKSDMALMLIVQRDVNSVNYPMISLKASAARHELEKRGQGSGVKAIDVLRKRQI